MGLLAKTFIGKVKVRKQYTCDDLIFDIEKMSVSTGRLERSLNYNECLLFKAFIDSANEVIDKEALKQAGWPDTIVTDSSLQKSVQKLRLAIAISEHVELRTISGVGYMLYYRTCNEASPTVRSLFNSLNVIKALLVTISLVLVVLSFFNFSRVTNTHFFSYIHDDYEIIEIHGHQVLKHIDIEIPPEILSFIQRSKCDCFYFIAKTESFYTLSIYEKEHQRSENHSFEINTIPMLIEELE